MAILLLGTTIGGYAAIHAGNIGSQSVNYANSSGSTTSITANTGLLRDRLAASANIDGLTASNFRTTLFGSTTSGYQISTARWNNVPGPLTGINAYGTMIAWAGSDTHSFIAVDYSTPGAIIGGGSGNLINWSKKLAFADGTGASGTWGINITGSAGSAPNGSNINNYYDATAGNGYGFRFWNGSDSYKISMGVGTLYQYGPVTDYSIKAQMNDGDATRGFTWGRISYAPIAALNSTTGDMQIAGSFTANLIIKSGGTSSQFLKADGTIDTTAYVPPSRTITINGVTQDLSVSRSWTISSTDSTKLPLAGGTMSGTIVLQSISGTDQVVENTYGAYLHLGAWGVARLAVDAVLVNTAWRADALWDMNISQFTNNSGYITASSLSAYLPLTGGTLTGTLIGTYIRARATQTIGNYTTAALWTESYDNSTTGIAFHISGVVGKFLEMRTNGILYWEGTQVVTNAGTWGINVSGTAASISGYNNPTTAATANTIVYRDPTGHIYGNYGFYSFINSTDNVSTGTITHIIAKFGDDYHRSATAAKVQTFLGLASAAYRASDQNLQTTDTVTFLRVNATNFGVSNAIYFGGGNNYLNWTNSRIYSNVGIESAVSMYSNGYQVVYNSGTWGINVSGNAATVSNGVYTNVANTIVNGDAATLIVYGASTYNAAAALHIGGWSTDTTYARIRTSNGNLHFDTRGGAGNAYQMYFNHYSSGDMYFGYGGGTVYIYGGRLRHSDGTPYVTNSGTWGISTTGNAATATYATTAGSADQIDGWDFRNTGSNSATSPDTIDSNGISYTSVSLLGQSDGALYSQRYSTAWQHQIFGDYRTGQLAVRGKNSGTWQAWRTILDSSNYNSYAPSLTGAGASGTWGINITGSSGSTTYALNSTRLYASDSPYTYGGAAPYYMYMNYDGGSYWELKVTPATPSGVRVAYANIAGSASIAGTASQVTINYNDNSNANYQLLWGSGNSVYGTGDVYVNPSSDVINARGGFISNSNPWSTANSAFFPNGITTAGNDNWVYGHTYVGNAPGNGAGHEYWTDGSEYHKSSVGTASHGQSGRWLTLQSATGNFIPYSFESDRGNHSWGTVARFRVNNSESDRPSLQFSWGGSDNRWNVGYCSADDNFRITQNMGYRNDNSTSDGWGTERFKINTDGTTHLGIQGATTTAYGAVRLASNNNLYLDNNYGQTIVGVYSSTVYQGIWAMGDSYKLPINGSTTGSLYGLAWSHPNAGGVAGNLNTHGLLVMENGTFLAAISGNIRSRDSMYAGANMYATSGYFYGSGSIRVGDMWDGAGLYRPSGKMIFGTENDGWRFTMANDQKAWIGTDGNIWMKWAGKYMSTLLDEKSNVGHLHDDRYFFDYGFTTGYPGTEASGMPGNRSAFTYSNGAPLTGCLAHFGAAGYGIQLNGNYNGDEFSMRSRNGDAATWRPWKRLLTDYNYTNYSPTLTGGGASGTWGINITGNAATTTTSTYSTYLNPLSGDSNYKLAYTANGARNNAGEWGRAVMYYVPNGQTYGIRVDRADYADGAGSVAWSNVSGRPTTVSSFTNDSGYITSGSNVVGLYSSGWGNGNFTWYQTSGGLAPYGGSWASFLVSNHGDGSNYYNQTIIMPFWGAPQYSRREGGTNRGPWTFWTTENLDPNSISGNFYASGTITAGSDVIAYSDARIKTNIQTINNALEKVLSLRGVTYMRTDSDDTREKIGVIAQEVQKVLPQVVFEQSNGILGVSYGNMIGVLIEAIKEQQKEIDGLKAKLN